MKIKWDNLVKFPDWEVARRMRAEVLVSYSSFYIQRNQRHQAAIQLTTASPYHHLSTCLRDQCITSLHTPFSFMSGTNIWFGFRVASIDHSPRWTCICVLAPINARQKVVVPVRLQPDCCHKAQQGNTSDMTQHFVSSTCVRLT